MEDRIEIYTLGRLAIRKDGQDLEGFVSTKTMLLFVYLCMNPRRHSRESLATLLWSDTSDEQARKNLRTVLSSLRKQLPDTLIVSRQSISLDPQAVIWVDAIALSEELPETSTRLEKLRHLESLAELYHGDFLVDIPIRGAFSFEEWVVHLQQEIHRQYLQTLYQIVELSIECEAYDSGLSHAQKLVGLDPLWEAAQRQLMQLLVYMNHPNEAILQYERVVQLLSDELDTEPEPQTIALYEQIKAGEIQPPTEHQPVQTIVLPDSPFVAPEDDLDYLQRMLDTPQCRLLTIHGISGIGKTTLASQIAFQRQNRYTEGAHIIPLVNIQTEDQLALAIINTLGIKSSGGDVSTQDLVVDSLKTRNCLLILDNYEQLLPQTQLLQRLLDEAPQVQLIVTSQTQLNLYNEWLLPLQGLQVLSIDDEQAGSSEAIRLFDMTAKRVAPRFKLHDCLADVVQICQLVDGLPLGIIIAAGWVQYVPPEKILTMMREDLLAVESVHQDIPARHQGFDRLLKTIWEHLSVRERKALTCLSIFKGTFDHKAALAVADIDMPEFVRLVNKSLIQRNENFRYVLHRLLQQAFEKHLLASRLYETVFARFSDYYQSFCYDIYDQQLSLTQLMLTIDADYHNIWHVDVLPLERQQEYILNIAPALAEYWTTRGYNVDKARGLLQDAVNNTKFKPSLRAKGYVELAEMYLRINDHDTSFQMTEYALELEKDLKDPYIHARALRTQYEIMVLQGNYIEARAALEQILKLEDQVGNVDSRRLENIFIAAYGNLGTIAMELGDYETAAQHTRIAMQHFREMGDHLRESMGLTNLGIIALKTKDYDQAFNNFNEALSIATAAKHDALTLLYSSNLGEVVMLQGNLNLAYSYFADALQIAIRIQRKTSIINIMEQFAQLAMYLNQPTIATQLFGFTSSMRQEHNLPVAPRDQDDHQKWEEHLKSDLGADYQEYWNMGNTMGQTNIIQVALSLKNHL